MEHARTAQVRASIDTGEPSGGQGSPGPQDRPDRCTADRRISPVWSIARQLYPTQAGAANARTDPDAGPYSTRPQPRDQSDWPLTGNSQHQARFGGVQHRGQKWAGDIEPTGQREFERGRNGGSGGGATERENAGSGSGAGWPDRSTFPMDAVAAALQSGPDRCGDGRLRRAIKRSDGAARRSGSATMHHSWSGEDHRSRSAGRIGNGYDPVSERGARGELGGVVSGQRGERRETV